MKSLYESILSSTGSGKAGIEEFVKSLLAGKAVDSDFAKRLQKLNKVYKCNSANELQRIMYKFSGLVGWNCSLNWVDVKGIKDLSRLFKNSAFNGDISEWDVSECECMDYMFHNCYFTGDNGNIDKWDVSKVKSAKGMFTRCSFNKDISKWNFKSLKNYSGMFGASFLDYENRPKLPK